ncbi:MAG: peptidoglycan DD-metalloendopeptidase family protein [Bacilli bacterium]
MAKAIILAIKEAIKDLKKGGKKIKIIVLVLISPIIITYCIFSYVTSWFDGLFKDQHIIRCMEDEQISNSAYAFMLEIDDLKEEKMEKFIKKYYMKKNECNLDGSEYDKIQKDYNLTDKQIENIKKTIESIQTNSTYDSNIGKHGYVTSVTNVTSCYGMRGGRKHNGIDIAGLPGQKLPIFAYDKGEVIQSGYNNVLGYHVIIKHSKELKTRYFHFFEPGVKVGTKVKKGDQIGVMGTSGDSTGFHLHFEILMKGKQIDPYEYLVTTGVRCD